MYIWASQLVQGVRNLQCRRHRRLGFYPWVGKILWRRKWQPTPVFSCLENSMDRGAWWATVHRVAKSWTWLKWLSTHARTHIYIHIYTCCVVLSSSVLHATPWTIAGQAPLSMGILQARILESVAMPSSRRSSQPRDQIQVSRIAGRSFSIWATREAREHWSG